MQPGPSWEGHHTAASSGHPPHYCHYTPPASQGAGYEQQPLSAAPYGRSAGESYQYGDEYEWRQPFPVTAADPLERQDPMQRWSARTQDRGTGYGQYDQSYGTDEQSYGRGNTLGHADSNPPGVSQCQGQQFQAENFSSSKVPTSSHQSGIDVEESPLGCHGDESLDRGYSRSEYENSFLAKTQRYVMRNAQAFDTLTRETARLEKAVPLHEAKGEESCEFSLLGERRCSIFSTLSRLLSQVRRTRCAGVPHARQQ